MHRQQKRAPSRVARRKSTIVSRTYPYPPWTLSQVRRMYASWVSSAWCQEIFAGLSFLLQWPANAGGSGLETGKTLNKPVRGSIRGRSAFVWLLHRSRRRGIRRSPSYELVAHSQGCSNRKTKTSDCPAHANDAERPWRVRVSDQGLKWCVSSQHEHLPYESALWTNFRWRTSSTLSFR